MKPMVWLRSVMAADYRSMLSIRDLWDRFHLAQGEHNTDAALCFRHAIEAYNRSDYSSALFWYLQARMCEPVAALTSA
jgi:hypothetical protein